jgi:nucleotide-binding universal stress UspA family protein
MIKTILVPTDGSVHAAKAVDLAADIAGKYNARLVILHVLLSDATAWQLKELAENIGLSDDLRARLDKLEEIPIEAAAFGGESIAVQVPTPIEMLKEVADLVTARARADAVAKGVGLIDIEVVGGRPADAILAAAERTKADMIIMGSRGLGGLKGLLVGSVSHKVNHMAECTCVTVK